ncbi:MAG: ATP-binding cassette domain-containing protein [Pirellulales bacterium]|nr:ATP-binding cassette domain-containing protein [Pirellulales bacterium]
MTEPLLTVNDLRVHFPIRRGVLQTTAGHVRAVDGVTFAIKPGETLGLVGESGCGKTTTGRAILRLIPPTGGQVVFQGRDLTNLPEGELRALRSEMQIVFQDPYSSLNPRHTVRGIVEEGLILHENHPPEKRLEIVKQTLSRVGLDPEYLTRYPHEFSGGQRQRISLARALAVKPKFLVLDEPISALDVSIQAQVVNLLVELKQQLGLTYLFISHDLSMVEYISDRVAVMYLGQIVELAPSAELYRAALHPYTHALLSAIPRVRAEPGQERIPLTGDVPSPANPPRGCRFHPRCPLANERCQTEEPYLLNLGDHQYRCHRVEELARELPNKNDPAAAAQISREIAGRMATVPAV